MLSLFNIILTCSKCIFGCLKLCLASDEGTKSIDRYTYIVTADIANLCAKNTYIGNACVIGA